MTFSAVTAINAPQQEDSGPSMLLTAGRTSLENVSIEGRILTNDARFTNLRLISNLVHPNSD